jgi:N-acetylglucosaminyldiphosphoundecaprenol N-acetyl-beta-D-mannosaminyltransferase
MSLPEISLFGMKIHAVTMSTAAQTVLSWCRDQHPGCRYVVTPNVDHAVMFQSRADLRQAYASASLVVADGAPLVAVARFLRRLLPERVAGSDLVPATFDQVSANTANQTLRVFLLGAAPGVADRAGKEIHRRWKNVKVVGTYSPPLGFENDAQENQRILAMIADAQPDMLLVGLGAPKQELWVERHAPHLQARVALCVGATIDFLAGEKLRSPLWMRRMGLEWFHRLCSEPSRLAKRYLRDAWIFPRLVWREWRGMRA